MASPPEIVSVEDTPADLIPVADEAAIRRELEAWRGRVLKRPGL